MLVVLVCGYHCISKMTAGEVLGCIQVKPCCWILLYGMAGLVALPWDRRNEMQDKGERSWDDLGLLVGLLVCVARQDYKACGRVLMTGSASDSGFLTEKCKVRAR